MKSKIISLARALLLVFIFGWMTNLTAQTNSNLPAKFSLARSGLTLARRTQPGSFFDVVGRRSAVYGYEHRQLEAWVHPLKIFDRFELGFQLEGYPLEFRAADLLVKIDVRPEATVFTYSHAAFTIRQIVFAPLDEMGIVMLLDVDSTLPLKISARFEPELRLAWAGNLMTPSVSWSSEAKVYYLTEESKKFVGVVGSPLARDVSVMPYQEEPQDVPAEFLIEAAPQQLENHFIPLVVAASVNGITEAKATYNRILNSIPQLYEKNVEHYRRLQNETTVVATPDEKLNRAFAWAKVGVDKGVATNPFLGTGLIAGFRASGRSERAGFAWFFGRDALWTTFATNSYGDFQTTRTALEFLRKFQRADGKIPHEISQSASLIPWFTNYEYAWAAADATPLYVVACWDYYNASGDREFLKASWESIQKAYDFTRATDTDKNGLVENTSFGHGWVEGGALYPPHEEIYQQAMWFAASNSMAEIAAVMNDRETVKNAKENAERVRAATEQTFWLADRDFYAYATKLPTEKPVTAEPGPNKEIRQARLNELAKAKMFDEDTVLPAVPLWFRMFDEGKSQKQLDRLGSSKIAADWGARILANDSKLYDPLSYHHGSVWGLFTGWQSLAAYNYGRPHIGFQALYANAELKFEGNALGYITELLSGDFNAPFGRSSHHQIWSEAMIVTPAMRGLFGIEILDAGKLLRFAPALPADWTKAQINNVAAGSAKFNFQLSRPAGKLTIGVAANNQTNLPKLVVAPAFALDAKINGVSVNGKTAKFNLQKIGDLQRAEVVLENLPTATIIFDYEEGTEVFYQPEPLQPGAKNQGMKIIRAFADDKNLHLILEGLGGRTYALGVRSSALIGKAENVKVEQISSGLGRSEGKIFVSFDGSPENFTRREIVLPLGK